MAAVMVETTTELVAEVPDELVEFLTVQCKTEFALETDTLRLAI